MAFTSAIKGRYPCPPPMKRLDEAYRLERVWGTYVSDGGSTGGEIDPECDNVLFAQAADEDAAAAIRIQTDIASAGVFTITTAANSSGRWEALVAHRKA
jgi:hypothetical protein